MTLGEKIREQRVRSGLSQESIASMVGVSRQAVTKWESGQSLPSSENLISLARIFHISLDDLVSNDGLSSNRGIRGKRPTLILRSNLTMIAIALQAGFLHSCTTAYYNIRTGHMEPSEGMLLFTVLPLLLCSIWMASNHRFEKDPRQRKKNAQIELIYCLLQSAVALLTMRCGMGLAGLLLTLAVCLIYVLVINPRYMKRKFTK